MFAHPVRIGTPVERDVTIPETGWMRIEAALGTPGIHRLTAESIPALSATSNPIEAVEGPPGDLLFWGDLHAQSVIGCGARSIDAYSRHARDFAATDFGSHQANCFLV
jgi:hypothetical protein